MSYEIKTADKFSYVEEGQGEVLMLLHGLFGALSNYRDQIEHYKQNYKVVVPLLPIYEMSVFEASLGGLTRYTHEFIELMGYNNMVVLGNSLGGHIAALYALKHPSIQVAALSSSVRQVSLFHHSRQPEKARPL